LTPWRFALVGDNQRQALAQLLSRALTEEDPSATPAHHAAEEEFARYSGQLVVLISAPVENHKIPVWEQQLSCGTVGMNLLTAAHALGYVAGWSPAGGPIRDALMRPSARPESGSRDSSSSASRRGNSK